MATKKLYLQMKTEESSLSTVECRSDPPLQPPVNVEGFRSYISRSVSRYFPTGLVPPDERPAWIEDVTQNAWIKFWSVMSRPEAKIVSAKLYLDCIIRSACIDGIRSCKRKYASSLPLDPDGELQQGKVLLTASQESDDPAEEYELREFINEIIDEVMQLPTRQRYAMICVLKDEVGQTFPLAEAFEKYGIDTTTIEWPGDPLELQRLRTLLSQARKTLRGKYDHFARRDDYSPRTPKNAQVAGSSRCVSVCR
jgi:DNA-directed RNA polymerase specialized sigma24 family protein